MAHFTNRSFSTGILACLVIAAYSAPTQAIPSNQRLFASSDIFSVFSDKPDTLTTQSSRIVSPDIKMASITVSGANPSGPAKLSSDTQQTNVHATASQSVEATKQWLNDSGLSNDAHTLIRAIRNAKIHGLDPHAYQIGQISSAVDEFVMHIANWHPHKQVDTPRKVNERALGLQLSALLDNSFVKLVKDLGQGVIDGRDIQKRLYRDPPKVNARELLQTVKNAEQSVAQVLASVTPGDPGYVRLTQSMDRLLTERAAGIPRTRVNDGNTEGAASDDSNLQWDRLIETGDLIIDEAALSSPHDALADGLKAFQARHGLEQSGVADAQTRHALNASVDEEIEAVAMSLERFRWLPRDLGKRHLFVNIPDFQVSLIDDDKTTLRMRAVMGKASSQTPSFSEEMSFMEFNPTWTVPRRIAQNELVPSERKNPGYLASHNFRFLKKQNNRLVSVPASSVTRAELNAKRFPYVLQQRGGAGNALGKMKFMMPNKYAIYLHDTPSQQHFKLNERAYSHGCVRLADPQALAQALLLGDGYDQSTIERSLRSKKTHRLKFRQAIPTHLVYMTSWIDENGQLQTRPDVYDNDAALLNAMRDADTLIGTMNTQLLGQADLAVEDSLYR